MMQKCWTSLVVQWLRLSASTAGGMGLIPGQGTKIPYATWHNPKKKKKKKKTVEVVISNFLGTLNKMYNYKRRPCLIM